MVFTSKEKTSLPQPDLTDLTLPSNGGYLLPTYLYMLSHERNVHLTMLNESKTWQAWVKYGVRSLKFIWVPSAQLYSLAKTPQSPPPPYIRGASEGAIDQPR